MARKKIRVAVWEYRTDEGKRRLAYFGDTVDLSDDEIERGTRAGVFDQPEPPASAADKPDEAPSDPPADDPKEPESTSSRPTKPRPTATAAKWASYAKAIGIDEDEVEAAQSDKDSLIALVDAFESDN
ncbi:hypothetical protein [Rhodococcus sp. 11-3]|uniref:hypothetical protein n=1 Tax=Rhodococcus sp. 11-3 TaxID=2854796 RepID=UPI00203FB3A6|nr:hypothetical protein [Rhodococcus sp. 11-3]USC16221.1 hypothetical protein KZJ41_04670 [Rhodococcus sp. 11-3]